MKMYEEIKYFIENLKISDYAKNTLVSYEIHLRNFYSYCKQNNVDYKIINAKEMLQYRTAISKLYKPSSINAKLAVINSFYNFMIDLEEVTKNPIRKTMYIRKGVPRPKPLDPQEKHLFFSYIETKEKHIELGFKLLFDTGIRISELIKLKSEDVKILNNRAFLNIENSKNKKTRIVPIFSQEVIEELFDYMEGNYEGQLFFYSTRAFQLYAEQFTERFGIKFTTHMARHTFATEKLNEGMRIDILKEILGHEDIRTTMYYALTNQSNILKLGGYVDDNRTF